MNLNITRFTAPPMLIALVTTAANAALANSTPALTPVHAAATLHYYFDRCTIPDIPDCATVNEHSPDPSTMRFTAALLAADLLTHARSTSGDLVVAPTLRTAPLAIVNGTKWDDWMRPRWPSNLPPPIPIPFGLRLATLNAVVTNIAPDATEPEALRITWQARFTPAEPYKIWLTTTAGSDTTSVPFAIPTTLSRYSSKFVPDPSTKPGWDVSDTTPVAPPVTPSTTAVSNTAQLLGLIALLALAVWGFSLLFRDLRSTDTESTAPRVGSLLILYSFFRAIRHHMRRD